MSNAVEAAAKAVCEANPHPGGGSTLIWEDVCDQVEIALDAALPHLTEGLAEVIAKAVSDYEDALSWYTYDPDANPDPDAQEVFIATAITEELKRRIEG